MAMSEEMQHRFKYHPPSSPAVIKAHEEMRLAAALFASMATLLVPEGRERCKVYSAIEEAMFWGNAGIARAKGNTTAHMNGTYEEDRAESENTAELDEFLPPGFGPR